MIQQGDGQPAPATPASIMQQRPKPEDAANHITVRSNMKLIVFLELNFHSMHEFYFLITTFTIII